MKKRFLFSLLITVVFTFTVKSQNANRGNLFLHGGSVALYSTASVGYEAPNFLKRDNHYFTAVGSVGLWNAILFGSNSGFQTKAGLMYLSGAGNNHFEFQGGLTLHFDESLDQPTPVLVVTLPYLFLGYRYQNYDGRFFFKAGLGLLELVQLGVGIKL